METINNWCFFVIYLLVLSLVVIATFLGVECLKNVGLHATIISLDEENGNTRYNQRNCSRLETDGIYTV